MACVVGPMCVRAVLRSLSLTGSSPPPPEPGNMSNFFLEDLVTFKNDKSILATIAGTWSDVDPEPIDGSYFDFFFHKRCVDQQGPLFVMV